MTDSTKKPAKPYPAYPLFAHATGRWATKIRGKLHYFGPWRDPDGALEGYHREAPYLHAGRTPPEPTEGLTLQELINRFLTSKQAAVDAGKLKPRTWRDYHTACRRLVETFGLERAALDLTPDDFEHLRNVMAKTMGATARKTEIQRTRTVFNYSYQQGLIERPIRYGQAFRSPPRRVLQKARVGSRMFEAAEIRRMIGAASPQFRAMILLGVNCGFGNTDIATLTLDALDLETGWLNHPRPKTGTERRCPLWPETTAALRAAIATRREPKDRNHADLVFLTQQGNPWVRLQGNGWNDAVTIVCRELLGRLGLKRPGRNFYGLRHTFETVAGESIDQVAVNYLMGHEDQTMAGVYRERISEARLRAVVDHVRAWLLEADASN